MKVDDSGAIFESPDLTLALDSPVPLHGAGGDAGDRVLPVLVGHRAPLGTSDDNLGACHRLLRGPIGHDSGNRSVTLGK